MSLKRLSWVFLAIIVALLGGRLMAADAPSREKPPTTAPADAASVRSISVPARENGYSNFESTVLDTQASLDAFLKKVDAQDGWNERPAFVKALRDAKVDFEKESIALIRHTESSGSNTVSLSRPTHRGEKLVYVIHRKEADMGTADMAYYCYAVAVEKRKVRQVEVWINKEGDGKPATTLHIAKPGK